MNTPNKLTLTRIILSPVFMLFIVYPVGGRMISLLIAAVIFGLAALTDFFDGMLARKYGQITNFGIFLDPLADKFMIFAALLSICFSGLVIEEGTLFSSVFFWASGIIIFRELAVTSMRLVVSGEKGIVVPANYLGKIKTVTQIICVLVTLFESALFPDLFGGIRIFGMVMCVLAAFFTVISGFSYLKAYWKYIKPNK